MNEQDIRDRIGKFLKRTAHTVLVPATMGLGFSSTGCETHGLQRAGDAGLDTRATPTDGPMAAAHDTAVSDLPLANNDLPLMFVPYVVAMALDAAPTPDTAVDGTPTPDANGDVSPDIRADIPLPPPPYGVMIRPRDGGQDGRLDSK